MGTERFAARGLHNNWFVLNLRRKIQHVDHLDIGNVVWHPILCRIPKNCRTASRKMPVTLKQLEQRYKLACDRIKDCEKYTIENFATTIHRDFQQLYQNINESYLEELEVYIKKVEEMTLQARVAIKNEKICCWKDWQNTRKRWKIGHKKRDSTIYLKCKKHLWSQSFFQLT